jgi:antitoxin ParD1/3/4
MFTFDITGHYEDFVNQLVTSGRYSNPSEVVREGLRLLEQHEDDDEHKLATLRKLAKEGFDQLDRGEGIVLHGDEELEAFIREAGRKAAESVRRHTDVQ